MQQSAQVKTTIDEKEVAQFASWAEEWWDFEGKFKPLHAMNPVRMSFMKEQICRRFGREQDQLDPLVGLSLLDIGCGGGLICEPMARLGATVTGVDAAERNIEAARLHAEQMGLSIDYRASTAEALAEAGERYDVVLALEIAEHVADVGLFVASCAALLKPGGLLIMSTINRTMKSLALAKIGAEYVLRLLPRGTHDWRKFLKPSELATQFQSSGLVVANVTGMTLDPYSWNWHINPRGLAVNYFIIGQQPG